MQKKTLAILLVFLIANINEYNALIVLQDEMEATIASGSSICTNQVYNLVDGGNSQYKDILIYDEHYFLEEYQTNSENTEIIIPNGVDNITVKIVNPDDENNEEILEYKIQDCGNEEIKNEYDIAHIQSEFEVKKNSVQFNIDSELENYKLIYKTKDELKGKQLEGKNTSIAVESYPQTIQIEEYYEKDDKISDNYYELNINSKDDYEIRKITSFNITAEGFKPINNKYYIYIIILLVLFLFFKRKEKNIVEKKKIRAKKKTENKTFQKK